MRSEAISAFADISFSDSSTSSGSCRWLVLVAAEAGDDLCNPPLDAAALGLELERVRVAVGERRVDAIEERLRSRRARRSEKFENVVDEHVHVHLVCGTRCRKGIIEEAVNRRNGPRGPS